MTAVYGDNMRGKTSLMNAIRYAFFGEIHGHGDRTRGILTACNRDLVAQGKYGFSVALSVAYEGQDYDLVREAVPKVAHPRRRPRLHLDGVLPPRGRSARAGR